MKTILATALLTMMAIAPTMAGEMQGKIKSVDMKKHEITMQDGMSVMVKPTVKLDGLKAGEQVKITTGSDKMATAVERVK
ncbi:uncharacterized protein DUF1344 [Pseudaminobacter salicylatoxidans]|uniref:Uncharacterized protein DUF1344 n=1 Tax=Pseudaminobacter salicylatoxidans TaxID=93369 RepID=A0A316C1D0_PSESE|nr:DUF1344 domain-containing protein [Pseudaminobacter salicylatoxidans]PWJ80511.1 uncharacterized protein DUF1344 [Pseudaminobacter salicylatoxidans]